MGREDAAVSEGRRRLEEAADPAGGWGYVPGGPVYVEPSALALLALAPPSPPEPPTPIKGEGAVPVAIKRLFSCQTPEGFYGSFPGDPEPSWATAFAVLALAAHGHHGNARLGSTWLTRWKAPAKKHDAASRQQIREVLKIDVAIPGWPWFGATSAWVEPTALACRALEALPVEGSGPRVADGLRYLKDRRISTGGWNYGNPHAFGQDLYALPVPTAKALMVLPPSEDLAGSLDVLERLLVDNPSRAAQAWGALAFLAHGRRARAEAAAEKAVDSGDGRGRFGGRLDAVALAVLAKRAVLGRAPEVLVSLSAKGGQSNGG